LPVIQTFIEPFSCEDRHCVMELGMWNKATDSVRFEILRIQSHFEIERLIDRATDNGFSAEDAIDALEHALEAMRSYRATRAKYSKTPRLF
jgi:hypothetical protein